MADRHTAFWKKLSERQRRLILAGMTLTRHSITTAAEGWELRLLRELYGLRQADVARYMGRSRERVRQIEEAPRVSPEVAFKYVDAVHAAAGEVAAVITAEAREINRAWFERRAPRSPEGEA